MAKKTNRIGVIKALKRGEWVDSDKVCKALNIDLSTAFKKFEFSRTAEWWSVCGTTVEERSRNGQKIVTQFRKKQNNKKEIKTK